MKYIYSIILFAIYSNLAFAQVPYFGKAPGADKLYGYTSVKFRTGVNNIETYNTFQYGITDFAACGIDYYTGSNSAYMGIMLRAGIQISQWLSIGGTATPSFNLKDNFEFSYFTGGLFMNGNITDNGNFFWCSNTWLGLNKNADDTINQFSYLGYVVSLKNGDAFTPMIGLEHSWKFDSDCDVAAGVYITHKMWNFYVWGNDFLKSHPRVVLGVDFKI